MMVNQEMYWNNEERFKTFQGKGSEKGELRRGGKGRGRGRQGVQQGQSIGGQVRILPYMGNSNSTEHRNRRDNDALKFSTTIDSSEAEKKTGREKISLY